MAHELYTNADGRAAMAYVGQTPWHGLGQRLESGADLEIWADAAGFRWEIRKSAVEYATPTGWRAMPERCVLYRSDTETPISVMSARYREVQPMAVLEFFREVCEARSWTLETAGVLRGGAQYWALAKAGPEARICGSEHRMYMLLATSADGSLATLAQGTDVRVVCRNTLGMALRRADGCRVKVRHTVVFDPRKVKTELGTVDVERSWEAFVETMRALGEVPVSAEEATGFFARLIRPRGGDPAARSFAEMLAAPLGGRYSPVATDRAAPERAIRGLAELERSYREAPGAAPGTAYGLVQGVTHYLDHVRGKDRDRRLSSAWFGQGADMKAAALDAAIALTRR